MRLTEGRRSVRETAVAALMLLQGICVALFIADLVDDLAELRAGQAIGLHLGIEIFANLGLIAAVAVEGLFLRRLLARQAQTEKTISAASGALHELMQDYFASWALTPAEIDVATFTIKGFSIAEIADLRRSSEGTVKSHLNAIYRKSGLAGRGQLVSILIEELLQGPLTDRSPD